MMWRDPIDGFYELAVIFGEGPGAREPRSVSTGRYRTSSAGSSLPLAEKLAAPCPEVAPYRDWKLLGSDRTLFE